jgi:hypothetical protein
VRDAGPRVPQVDAESRLSVGPDRNEAVPAPGREDDSAQETGHQVAALVFGRRLRGASEIASRACLDEAVALAATCPLLARGGGIEVGVVR